MKNKISKTIQYGSLSIAFVFSLGIAQVSFAEGVEALKRLPLPPRPGARLQEVGDLRNDASTSSKEIRGGIRDVRQDIRQKNRQEREEVREDIKDIRDDMRNGSTTREEGLQEMRDRFEEGRKNIKLNRGQASSTIEKLRTELFAREFRLVIARLNAGIERLETIASRIDSRIAKLDQSGANTADAKTKLAEARTKITKAKSDVALIVLPISSSTPTKKEQMDNVKVLIGTAKKSIKSAQEALVATIRIIAKESGNATSTENN